MRLLGYERVYLSLFEVADETFHGIAKLTSVGSANDQQTILAVLFNRS